MTFERGEGRAVWTLALTQALGYACFFYVFAALFLYWQRDGALSEAVIAAGPLLATAVSAVVAPAVGRAVDRGQAVAMMAAMRTVAAAGPWISAMNCSITQGPPVATHEVVDMSSPPPGPQPEGRAGSL